MDRCRATYLVVASLLSLVGRAQLLPEFNMSDTTVTECKGILLDSEVGPGGNLYGNNEDFTFTIDAGSQITLIFRQFRIGRIDLERRVYTMKRSYRLVDDPRENM